MLISKGSFNTLVQVTDVDADARTLTFADGDSLRLNQSAMAANGTLAGAQPEAPSTTRVGDAHLADADDHLLPR